MSMLRERTLSRWLAVLALASASCTAIDPPPASPPEFRPLHTRATLHLGEKELADGRFVGLAFSGGGSRAAVFGAAVMKELDRLGVLQQVDVLSAVSGGALPAASYALEGYRDFNFQNGFAELVGRDFQGAMLGPWYTVPQNAIRYALTDRVPAEQVIRVLDDRLFRGPSILSADFARLAEEVARVEDAGADWLHIDVMDGHFVPNLTVGPPIVEALRKVTTLPLDVHLMMTNPDAFIGEFAEAGADYLTVHVETCPHLHRTVQSIKERGVKAGVTLNPATPAGTLSEIVRDADLILIMSVNPGFGGQKFIASSLRKIAEVRALIDRTGSRALLEVDGGVKPDNVQEILAAGAEVLVAGSAVFSTDDYAAAITALRAGHEPAARTARVATAQR